MQPRFNLAASAAVLLLLGGTAAAQTRFVDVSKQSDTNWLHYTSGVLDGTGDVGAGMLHWFGGSMSAGDFDNDGWQDIFLCGGGMRSDQILNNKKNGTFRAYTNPAGVGKKHQGAGVAVGDYDADGWLDIYVLSHGDPNGPSAGQHLLYHNNGDGTFTEVAAAAGVNTTSVDFPDGQGACFCDYDLDGDLDLYATSWRGWRTDPDALGNILFRNNGDGTFTDVTVAAGIQIAEFWGFSPTFADMDGDRYPELMVAADHQTSKYFKNNGDGTFTEMTAASGTGLDYNGMGAAVGDVNNDGLLDWYVTAIWETGVADRPGNMLYINQGNHLFIEDGQNAGVHDGFWGWGTIIQDMDNDGWQDIVETNGWVIPAWKDKQARLWINKKDGTFNETSTQAGLNYIGNGRAIINFDMDNDGDQDLMFGSNRENYALYRNQYYEYDLPNGYLRVFLDTSNDPGLAPNGIGAMVHAEFGGNTYVRCVDGGSHYMGQSELSAQFGLGNAAQVDTLTVFWPDGSTTVMNNVPGNQTLTIVAP